MTKEEYKKRLEELKIEFDKKKRALVIKYAVSNNTISVGDIIQDHIGKGRVLKIKYSYGYHDGIPYCIYICEELKMDGTPKKRYSERHIHQCNLKTE